LVIDLFVTVVISTGGGLSVNIFEKARFDAETINSKETQKY